MRTFGDVKRTKTKRRKPETLTGHSESFGPAVVGKNGPGPSLVQVVLLYDSTGMSGFRPGQLERGRA